MSNSEELQISAVVGSQPSPWLAVHASAVRTARDQDGDVVARFNERECSSNHAFMLRRIALASPRWSCAIIPPFISQFSTASESNAATSPGLLAMALSDLPA